MPEFTFTIPGTTIKGTFEPAEATAQAVVSVFAADFTSGEHEPGVVYELDSFVRMRYQIELPHVKLEHKAAEPHKPATKHAATKHK